MSKKYTHLHGNVPKHKTGSNIGRINHRQTSKLYGFAEKDFQKAYLNWLHIFRFADSSLTFEQYLNKLSEAKIVPTDVGNRKNQYNLARINDEGPYTNESCRFIL